MRTTTTYFSIKKRNVNKLTTCFFIAFLFFITIVQAQYRPDKDLRELFTDVQLARVFPDSKTFADCVPRFEVKEILEKYSQEKLKSDFKLRDFIEDNFILPQKIVNENSLTLLPPIRQHIDQLWEQLQRPASTSKGSLIGLPKAYVVPGGRFNEVYYWDSYFTMLGLKVDKKDELIKSMIDNFAFLINQYGFIPNGNRTYYLSRSQPPFFALMIDLLAEIKGDSIYKHYLPTLEKEYQFWMLGANKLNLKQQAFKRVVKLQNGSILNRYWDNEASPRAESFREDVETAKGVKNPELLYVNIKAACESGWDFSSRWFKDGLTLESIHITELIPVDLNCLLYHLELTLARAYELSDHLSKKEFYLRKAEERKIALLKYCWQPLTGLFMDYDFIEKKTAEIESLATVYPLYFKIASKEQAEHVAKKIKQHFLFPGGVITTFKLTSQQWDAPNGWAPLQYMTYKGLRNYAFDELADSVKNKWLRTIENQYKSTGKLLEKYNVLYPEIPGGGGEYPSQDGFGWTNGVYLYFKTEK